MEPGPWGVLKMIFSSLQKTFHIKQMMDKRSVFPTIKIISIIKTSEIISIQSSVEGISEIGI